MARQKPNNDFINILKVFGLISVPMGVSVAAVNFLWHIALYNVLTAFFVGLVIYLIWVELRLRHLEKRQK